MSAEAGGELTKDLLTAFAPYIVLGVVGFIVWEKYFKDPVGAASAALDTFATNAGQAGAVATYGPQTEYNKARSDYAASIDWDFVTQGMSVTGWPSESDWVGGAGPSGFTYGSANYPAVQQPTMAQSFINWAAGN